MTVLAFETSCDETSAAVIRDGVILSNVVSTQVALHAEYGGVVPELATREHLRNFLPVSRAALKQASVEPQQLDAIAATQGPGLPAALLVGLKGAQSMAYAMRKPFVGIHHHEAHLFSPWIVDGHADFTAFQPNVSLIVSGGHTLLVHVEGVLNHKVIGATIDDAAGECFDKTGKLMGLPYPAGPQIDKLAEQGNVRAFDFPRPMLHDPNDDFSFAGLKTSVRYFLQKNPQLLANASRLPDLCASVQAAIVEVLVAKTVRAAERLGVKCITASGGVACNSALRQQLDKVCKKRGFELRLVDKKFSTDNAAMIGILAERKLMANAVTQLDADIQPSWRL
jgi:N6-L-threonylcarbamoyladenine synthase